jgi:hypothetical protein
LCLHYIEEDILNKNCTNVFEYRYPCVGAAHIVCIDGHCYCCGNSTNNFITTKFIILFKRHIILMISCTI